ncbi:ATP-binding protein [Patescibacteria group bacterium]|nr:ATP-binding protein [Patescibacteria group bacterium]
MINNNEQLIKIIDFWRKSVEKDELQIRHILEMIDIKSEEIIDLVGPRRSGKSSVLKLIIRNLDLKGNFLYINFEDPFFISHNDPEIIEDLVAVFREYFNSGLRYLFFDEIQEIDHWEKAVRKLRDGENFKIFITGSSSKLLSGEISSLITGRHLSYKIFPLSFAEYIDFKKIKLEGDKDIVLKEKLLHKEFLKFMEIGGFPAVVTGDNPALLKNYFLDILQKDIIIRHDIREKDALEKMAVFVLSNSGKITTAESLKKAYNLSFDTVSSYLEYFKESFLVFDLLQFSFSYKNQSKTLKKIYAVDTGLASSVSFRFSEDRGRMLENVVFLELKRKCDEVFYYKNQDGTEVDFLTREKNKNKELIQVCWDLSDEETKKREVDSLLKAMNELKLKSGAVLTNNETGEINTDGKTIIIQPVFKRFLAGNLPRRQ